MSHRNNRKEAEHLRNINTPLRSQAVTIGISKRYRVDMQVRVPFSVILTEVFHSFPEFHQTNAGIVPKTKILDALSVTAPQERSPENVICQRYRPNEIKEQLLV